MQVIQTAQPLYHRGLLEVIRLWNEENPDYTLCIAPNDLSSEELYEELLQFSGLGPAQNMNEAGGVPFDEVTTPYSKRFYPNLYYIGWETSPQALRKDVYGVLKNPGQMMAESHYIAWQQAGADVINNSTSSSFLGIDGVALNSTAHPTASTTFSNQSTAAALGITAIETMLQDAMGQQAYRDFAMPSVGPFRLLVPRQLLMLAKRLIETPNGQPQTFDHDKNASKDFITGVDWSPFLTNSTRYALLPEGKKNPIFKLDGLDYDLAEYQDGRVPSHLFVLGKEYVYGWRRAQGPQFNEGA